MKKTIEYEDETTTIPVGMSLTDLRKIQTAVDLQIRLLRGRVVYSRKGLVSKIKRTFLGYLLIEEKTKNATTK